MSTNWRDAIPVACGSGALRPGGSGLEPGLFQSVGELAQRQPQALGRPGAVAVVAGQGIAQLGGAVGLCTPVRAHQRGLGGAGGPAGVRRGLCRRECGGERRGEALGESGCGRRGGHRRGQAGGGGQVAGQPQRPAEGSAGDLFLAGVLIGRLGNPLGREQGCRESRSPRPYSPTGRAR